MNVKKPLAHLTVWGLLAAPLWSLACGGALPPPSSETGGQSETAARPLGDNPADAMATLLELLVPSAPAPARLEAIEAISSPESYASRAHAFLTEWSATDAAETLPELAVLELLLEEQVVAHIDLGAEPGDVVAALEALPLVDVSTWTQNNGEEVEVFALVEQLSEHLREAGIDLWVLDIGGEDLLLLTQPQDRFDDVGHAARLAGIDLHLFGAEGF